MNKPAWKPWHQVVTLRDDLKSGELSLAAFAADLYDVVMGNARKVYSDPKEFFALTYPTFNLRELAKDVVLRLAGESDKGIRQLELTYGGGKTHTLIALLHLVRDPDNLPDLPSVQEFIQHIGRTPPKTRVAVLPFDKLDAEKGMECLSPEGTKRWLRNPWSVLAWQLAGPKGIQILHPEGKDAERDSAPAEPLLVEVLKAATAEGLSVLLLLDETLMYVREKVGLDPAWRSKLINFFQYLTQAVTKIDRVALVASLLATDPNKSDTLGKELTNELYAIFRREREEGVQPVLKEDVAEVLRRRFFKPESIRDREAFRPHVVAALKGIESLDDQTKKDAGQAEKRYLSSFPFHPDLTEVFYTKWTQLESFQRTRGILRTFALGLKDAERWDTSPLVGANAFIGKPGNAGLSESARELTNVAATEEYEGKQQQWSQILEGELVKARMLQDEAPGLKNRELEQSVFATFLHSQPIGQKATLRDLLVLVGGGRPDKIELEKGLRRWADVSWFLEETETGSETPKPLPKFWRLGSKPNLKQMHDDACTRVSAELVDTKLLAEIPKQRLLSAGAREAGVKVHVLPEWPKDIEDDGEFHYAILGLKAVSSSGNPSTEAKRFLDETTSSERPRVNRNALIMVVPSREGLDVARHRVKDYLGWEEVQHQLKDKDLDPLRESTLAANVDVSKKRIPEAILQMFGIVATVSDKNEAQAFKLSVNPGEALFDQIKRDARARIQDSAISADALLPDGPYNLWRAGETQRWAKDLVGAFAQSPHLPKMLRRKEILDTLVIGAKEGFFVLRLLQPDRTLRTFWKETPEEGVLKDPRLEVVLPEAAELSQIPAALLAPNSLPQLWAGEHLGFSNLKAYFAGGHVVQIDKGGYSEPLTIPKAEQAILIASVNEAVQTGKLCVRCGNASFCGEEVPAGLLTAESELRAAPQALSPYDVLPTNLAVAWSSGTSTALQIYEAIGKSKGDLLPWSLIKNVLEGAFRSRMVERTLDSGTWPCDLSGAAAIKLQMPIGAAASASMAPPTPSVSSAPNSFRGEAELTHTQLQDLADEIGEIMKVSVGYPLKLNVRIEVGGGKPLPPKTIEKLNELLGKANRDLRLT